MSNRWTSRKFITTLIAQLAALAVLFWPQHEQAILDSSQSIAALLVIGLAAAGYTAAEASVDRRRQTTSDEAESPLPSTPS